jgi:two-component system OmpR family sensor kinase
MKAVMHTTKASEPERGRPRSLRLRLILWYGSLIAIALSFFALLFLLLTTNAIDTSVNGALRTEARVAMLDVVHELSSTAPYWPDQLSLRVVDTYRDPGVVVEALDTQGHVCYLSANGLPSGNGPVIGVLLVAKSLSDVDATLLLLRALLLLSGVATLLGTLVASWLIGTRVLRPLSELVTTARSIAASTARGTRLGNLSQRVQPPGGHDELAQVVETFNEMLASLESATQAQRRFVADASHELRAPLTTIQGNLAFLQRHVDELPAEERRTMLADAHEETLRLAELVEELLLLARADASIDTPIGVPAVATADERTRNVPPIELDRVVIQLVRQLRRRLSVEGSTLQLEVSHIEPVRVHGDEESLRQVMLILLDNAIKYTQLGKKERASRVIVSLECIDGQAVLHVRDTGIGIEPADLPHIFERFYRADRARSRQGTGLGLSIAQTRVERLGGHITVKSSLGKGSTFSVWLPLA